MPGRASDTQTFAQVHMMLPSDLPVQDRTGSSWFHGIVLYCHRTYAHPTTVFQQTVAAVHAMQNGAQMRMTFDEEVTHVICYHCECHPTTVGDVHDSLHAVGYNTLLLSIASHGLPQTPFQLSTPTGSRTVPPRAYSSTI